MAELGPEMLRLYAESNLPPGHVMRMECAALAAAWEEERSDAGRRFAEGMAYERQIWADMILGQGRHIDIRAEWGKRRGGAFSADDAASWFSDLLERIRELAEFVAHIIDYAENHDELHPSDTRVWQDEALERDRALTNWMNDGRRLLASKAPESAPAPEEGR